MLLCPLNNIKIINYFNYKTRFNSVISRNNLTRIKDRVYVLNLNDKNGNSVLSFIDRNAFVYFDFSGIEHIPQELSKIKNQKSKINQLLTIYLKY